MKKNILISMLFVLVLLLSMTTIYFFHEYRSEREKLKMALVPSVNKDYFTQKVFKAQTYEERELGIEKMNDMMQRLYEETYYSDQMKILDVPRLGQMPEFPNGCEAVSATMFLNYHGVDISVNDFVEKYLPKSEVYEKDGIRYGPNPEKFYAGDPKDEKRGWGTFETTILSSVNKALEGTNYLTKDTTGTKLAYLIYDLPAIIWVGINYEESNEVYMWFNEEESEVYTYPKNSHTVLLVGYDKENFYINDPLKPEEVVKVERNKLEKSYNSYGRQSIIMYHGRTGRFK